VSRHRLGALDLEIDGMRACLDSSFKRTHLLIDASVEMATILVPPAGCNQRYIRLFTGERTDCFDSGPHVREVVQPELEEALALLHLTAGVLQ
jgi:hypothetical protein